MASCSVCNGTLQLLGEPCPLCDGDAGFLDAQSNPDATEAAAESILEHLNPDEAERVSEPLKVMAWEVNIGSWVRYDVDTEALIVEAQAAGENQIVYSARRQEYVVDLASMQQVNRRTGVARAIRCVEVCVEEPEEPTSTSAAPRSQRESRLVDHLLSPAVAVQLPVEAIEEPARLSTEEVRTLFKKHVPGVDGFLYRDMPGQLSLNFITSAYANGLRAFQGSDIHLHLLSLLRFTVHQFYDEKVTASRHLRDIAEAFTDCQAVQARVVERVGLELRGVRADFKGLVVKLIGDYKAMALQMLARERINLRMAVDDGNPTHYENRLTADIGDIIGMNKDEVRRSHLDEHAAARFQRLSLEEAEQAAARCRELFDLQIVLQAFVAEVNSFGDQSLPESLPCLFLDWVSTQFRQKHVVLDEATCSRADISQSMALAVFELLFFNQLGAEPDETYRGERLQDLFILNNAEDVAKEDGAELEANQG